MAANGVVGMLGGKIIEPTIGNAVENDIKITSFEILNSAGVVQNRDQVYSNQFFKVSSEIRLEDLSNLLIQVLIIWL